MEYTRLSEQLATAPQVRPEDLREIAASGFVAIVNNRPDGEAPDQPSSAELEAEAKRVGLAYWYLPVVPGAMTDADVRAFAAALDEAGGPVLAFCRTGYRSAALWKASQVRSGNDGSLHCHRRRPPIGPDVADLPPGQLPAAPLLPVTPHPSDGQAQTFSTGLRD